MGFRRWELITLAGALLMLAFIGGFYVGRETAPPVEVHIIRPGATEDAKESTPL